MGSNRPKVFRRFAMAGLLGLATLVPAARVPAQDHTPDPYKPYNGMYESFVYPTYPSGYGYVPNQGVLEGRAGYSAANRLQEFMDNGDTGLLGEGSYGPRRTGPGVPYYSAGRQYTRPSDNPYQARDQEFYKDQQARQEKYMAYLREKDPKRRAQLFREYQAESQRITRDLAAPRSSLRSSNTQKPATSAAVPATRPGAGGANRSTSAAASGTPGTRSSTRSLPSRTSRLNAGTRTPAGRTPSPSETLRRSLGSDSQGRSRSRVTPSPGTLTTPAPR